MPRFNLIPAGIAICVMAHASVSEAQSVIEPSPEASPAPSVPPILRQTPAAQDQTTLFAKQASQAAQPFQWGSLIFSPHLEYGFTDGNGIQASPGHSSNTVVQSFAPGLLADLGTHWTLDYTPTWKYYSNSAFSDSFDQAANLAGAAVYEDWTLKLSQGYVSSSDPLVETGGQTHEKTYLTSFGASDHLGGQWVIDTSFSQNIQSANVAFSSDRNWSTLDWLHFLYSPRLDAALGIGFGYTDVVGGTQIVEVTPQTQISWKPSGIVTFQVHAGLEHQEFFKRKVAAQNDPVAGLSLIYQPTQTTKLTATADRSVNFSYLENQESKTTSSEVTLEQRLLRYLFFTARAELEEVDYAAVAASRTPARNDQLQSLNLGLATATFLHHGTLVASYEISRNASNLPGFGFSSHQVGLQLGWRY